LSESDVGWERLAAQARALRRGDDGRLSAFHHRRGRVRSAEVDADDLAHGNVLLYDLGLAIRTFAGLSTLPWKVNPFCSSSTTAPSGFSFVSTEPSTSCWS